MADETKPKFYHVQRYLSQAIRVGRYSPGQRLPSERALAGELGMNHLTVRRGLEELVDQGLIVKQPRVGTFVADNALDPNKRVWTFALACRDFFFDLDPHHPSLAAYLAGAQRACGPPAHALQMLSYRRPHFHTDLGDALRRKKVDGVVVIGGGLTPDDYHFLRNHRIPAAVFEADSDDANDMWSVKLAWRPGEAMAQSVEHLYNLGHRRIAALCWSITTHRIRQEEAFMLAMSRLGLTGANELVAMVRNPTRRIHWEDVDSFFEIDPLPTAVIVNDEFIADALLSRCDQRGIGVPNDLSVVSLFDAKPFARRERLAAVHGLDDIRRMGYVGCRLLARVVKGYAVPRGHLYPVSTVGSGRQHTSD